MKESLNSDGQQITQYEQNGHPTSHPQIFEYLIKKNFVNGDQYIHKHKNKVLYPTFLVFFME